MTTTENATPGWLAKIITYVNEQLRKYPDIIRLMFITFAALEVVDVITDCLFVFVELFAFGRSSYWKGCTTNSSCYSLVVIFYVVLFVVFPITGALFLGKAILAIIESIDKKALPKDRMLSAIEIPVFNIFYLLTLTKDSMYELYEYNAKLQAERNDSLLKRIFGLHKSRALLCYKVPIGTFTFFPCFMDSESRKHLKGKKTRLWRILMYPIFLPFTRVYWNALWFSGVVFWFCSVGATAAMTWIYAPLFFLPNIIIFGDHSVTIRYFEDLPQTIIGLYVSQLNGNKSAALSAAVSLVLLGKTTFELIYFEIKNWNRVREAKGVDQIGMMDIYGPLRWYEALYLTTITPIMTMLYFFWFMIFFGVKYVCGLFLCFPQCNDGIVRAYPQELADEIVTESFTDARNVVELSNVPNVMQDNNVKLSNNV